MVGHDGDGVAWRGGAGRVASEERGASCGVVTTLQSTTTSVWQPLHAAIQVVSDTKYQGVYMHEVARSGTVARWHGVA